MLTDNQILSKMYGILNVSGVTSVINGGIWIGEKPVGRESEDIVINILTSSEEFNSALKTGTININCFVKMNASHTRDTARINTITNAVISALSLINGQGSSGTLQYVFRSQKTFRDNDNSDLFFSNIRLDFSYKYE